MGYGTCMRRFATVIITCGVMVCYVMVGVAMIVYDTVGVFGYAASWVAVRVAYAFVLAARSASCKHGTDV